MAGNSQRRGAVRTGNKKGPQVGSGGQRRRGLEGKGPTPKAVDRTKHPAHKRAKAKERANERERNRRPARKDSDSTVEWVYGRNPVVEALRAGAVGVVPKDVDLDALARAVERAGRGEWAIARAAG